MDTKIFQEISKKLDLLIKLNAVTAVKEHNLTEQVSMLSKVGLQPKDIAEILNKKQNHIRVILTTLKKGKGGKND